MDNKQCEGCYYWRGLSSTWGGGDMGCHYLIETGKMKKRDGNKCLSKRKGKHKRNDTPRDELDCCYRTEHGFCRKYSSYEVDYPCKGDADCEGYVEG